MAPKLLTVRVTTLTNETHEIKNVNPNLSVADLKILYERTGTTRVAAVQQSLWFSVPEGTEGAQSATAFKWWEKAQSTGSKPKELLDAMGANPLVNGADSQTIGGLLALQSGIDVEGTAGALQCFLIVNIKGGTKSWKLKRKATWKRTKASGSTTYKLILGFFVVAFISTTVGLILWRAMDRGIEGDVHREECDPTLYAGKDACKNHA